MFSRFFILFAILLPVACSNEGDEQRVIGLINAASQDVVAIEFSARDQDPVISASSVHRFSVTGTRSDGSTTTLDNNLLFWKVSAGVVSTIDQQGRLSASPGVEVVVVTASLGHLVISTSVQVSVAKFDRIVALPIDMPASLASCRPVIVVPEAVYFNDDGSQEVRPVDSNVLPTITWNVSDSLLNPSPRAFVENNFQDISLYNLAAGTFDITATAFSVHADSLVTSAAFPVNVAQSPQSVKICGSPTSDLAACLNVTDVSLSSGDVSQYLAVGAYISTIDGSTQYQNITRSVKWGNSNPASFTLEYIAGARDIDDAVVQLSVNAASTGTSIDMICGSIQEIVPVATISQGMVLDTAILCDPADVACKATTLVVNSADLTTRSLAVSLDGVVLVDNEVEVLASRPAEITLVVSATFSDNSVVDVTAGTDTVYTIIQSGGSAVIEEKAGAAGTFTVLGAGVAQIQVSYDGLVFLVIIDIP